VTTDRRAHAQVPTAGFRRRFAAGETWSAALASWRYLDAAVLGSIIALATALNLLWVSADSRPPYWDAARHLGDSLVYLDTFKLSDPLLPLQTYVYYPPFVYWVSDLFYAFFGTGLGVSILSQAVFLAVLVVSTYGIGKTLWNRRVGLLAAVFVVGTPLLASMFKWYMLDPPLTAMAALALYLLIRSESFSDTRFSLLFGLVCGLGTLTKWTFPLALWLPALAAAIVAVRSDLARRAARSTVNAVAAGALALAVCAVWFVHNWTVFRADGARYNARAADIEGDPALGSLRSLLWYAWNLLDTQLYLVPFVLFAVGLVFVFRKNDSATRNFYPILMIVGTYLAFTFLRNKDFRFTMPMLPAVAVVAVHWLEYMRPRVRQWLTGGIVAYSAVAFLAVSFGSGLLPRDLTIDLKARPFVSELIAFMPGYESGSATRVQGITVFAQHGWLVGPPDGDEWHQEEPFEEIATRGGQDFAFSGGDSIWFNTWGTRYYALKHHQTWLDWSARPRFLIARGPAPPGSTEGYGVARRWSLPDGETLTLFERP
jgi:4-amino-4-deoxy-L-arabinose transferase-like glycosyltransferase